MSILLLPTTGELLEESQVEASKLRQKAEDLVRDNKMLMASSSLEDLVETGGRIHKARWGGITGWLRILRLWEGEGVKETFTKVSCSPVISGVYQTTAILPSPGGRFLSCPHSCGRNHLLVPDLAGCLCSLHPCTRQGFKRLMAMSSPFSAAVGPDPSSTRAAPDSTQPGTEARKSPPSVSLVNAKAGAGMAGGRGSPSS